ncbi:MAG: uracil-DNA glycosylase, partial [Saprospiraceae bacterium]
MSLKVNIESSWNEILHEEFDKEYFKEIKTKLLTLKKEGRIIYPPGSLIFNAFNLCPFEKVKIVVLGQDPYHGIGEAMGLAFSVPKHIKIPPSLKNIFKEIQTDLGVEIPTHGDLSSWAAQGVLLLNA